jgi:hypothetical protein
MRYHNWYEPDVAVEMVFDRRTGEFTHVRHEISEKWQPLPGGSIASHNMAKRRAFSFVGRSDLITA